MYTGRRISVPDKSDYCNDGEGLGACVLAPLSHCPPAPFSTSSPGHFVLRAGCSLPRPRQARVALPARLESGVPEGYKTNAVAA